MLRTLLAALLLATLTPTRAENLTVTTARGEATVMKNPARFAVYDWAALDSLHQLGVKVPATTKPVRVDYLQPVFAAAQPVGELFKPDLEALAAYQPQLSITGNKVSAFGPKARLASWIHEDLGLEPVDKGLENAPHGQPVSFEYIHEKNPDWLFVLDRTAALGDPGAPALTVLDNELVRQTTAWQKGAGGADAHRQLCGGRRGPAAATGGGPAARCLPRPPGG